MLLRSKRKSYVSVRLPNRKASFCHKPVNECMEIDGKIYICKYYLCSVLLNHA
ncbi:hypothetical protein ERO13_A07G156350v2 [Gossypium hirsutum]|nr:hypothetical protein ERO13_A07G156350v2 [Gossypium hirsutum]